MEEGTRSLSNIIRGAKIIEQPVQLKADPPVIPEPPVSAEMNEVAAEEAVPENPAPSPEEIAAYIAQAENEAGSIIAQAREQAEQILNDARQAAGQLKDDAAAQGQALGYQQGREQGYQEVSTLLAQAAQIVEHARHEQKLIIENCEKDILELAISVATKVIHTEITANPEIVLAVVKDAIQKAKDQEQVTIRVNPADFETVAAEKQTLQGILRRETGMEIRGDIGVEPGGCVIETGYGAIDARIDTQLQAVKNALRGVVKHV